jgi:hypothetical protein
MCEEINRAENNTQPKTGWIPYSFIALRISLFFREKYRIMSLSQKNFKTSSKSNYKGFESAKKGWPASKGKNAANILFTEFFRFFCSGFAAEGEVFEPCPCSAYNQYLINLNPGVLPILRFRRFRDLLCNPQLKSMQM